MFPFRRGEVSFQASGEGDHETNNFEDLNMVQQSNAAVGVGSFNTSNNRGRGRARGRRSSSLATTSTSNNNPEEKLATHRDIERERRQKMSNLYSSLRSILPTEYTQGKRSISDHIEEAVHYIKDLEKNVKELGAKRDQLKNSNDSTTASGSSSSSLPGNVTIREFDAGLQVEITVGYDDDVLPMSAAIQVILEEGLNVVSCTSSRIGDRYFHHNLICEVSNDSTCVNVNQLQQRLTDLVS